jgi:hypothetical protein
MNFLDELQQAWQSQGRIDVKPKQVLNVARLQRRAYFWVDMLLISFFFFDMVFMLWSAFRKDIHEDWPWLISAASSLWVVGYILFNRWLQRRYAAHYDDSVLAHIQWSINDIEHRMRLDQTQTLWYVLPIAFGCMIPPVIFFAMNYSERPLLDSLIPCLFTEGTFAAVFYFVYRVLKFGHRMGHEARRKELDALRALRESLLNAEE